MDVRLGDIRIKSIYKGETPIPGIQIGSQLWHGSEGHIISAGVDIGKVRYNGTIGAKEIILVSSGGKWYEPESVGADARVSVLSGGSVNSVFVSHFFFRVDGGRAYNVEQTTGQTSVYNGGIIDSFVYNSAGYFHVSSGGTAYNGIVKANNFNVYNKGVVSNITVSSGGIMKVSSGGTALAVTSQAGAVIKIQNGGYIEYT